MLKGIRRRTPRPIFLAPAVVLVGAAVWLGYATSHHAAVASTSVDRLEAVSTGTIRQTVAASATLQPATTADLNFAVAGKVTAVNVKADQAVTKGTVLATIDSASLVSQVAQAKATVASDQARVSSDSTSGASAAQMSADQANLDAASAALATAESNVAGASLVAPIDGTVTTVNLAVGQQLGTSGGSGVNLSGTATGSGRSSAAPASSSATAPSTTSSAQVEVISTGSYVVNLSIDDTQIGKLKVGQSATIVPSTVASTPFSGRSGQRSAQSPSATTPDSVAAAPRLPAVTATGTVTSVGTVATATSGVASFPVTVSVLGNPTGLYSGSTVEVAITYRQLDNVIQVPTAAITQRAGQATVTVSVNGTKTNRRITTGVFSGGMTQVLSGLSAGEQVVVTVPATTRTTTGGTTNTGGAGGFGGFGGGPVGGQGPPPGGFGGPGG